MKPDMKEEKMEKYDSEPATKEHIGEVRRFLRQLSEHLMIRAIKHDQSKLMSPEKEIFDEFTPKLKNTTYGSDEYKQYLEEMGGALKHHYEFNRHHPEHFEKSIAGMNLVDIMEMLCDWKAATLRHDDGDMLKSIEINVKRFGICDQLKKILLNTIAWLEW